MTIRLSSALRDAVISNYGLGRCLTGGHIRLYAGDQPVSPDDTATGDLAGFITMDGVLPVGDSPGLLFALGDEAGSISMSGNWVARPLTGTPPTWWRFIGGPGMEDASMDGATEGDGMVIPPDLWAANAAIPITDFLMTLPGQ